MPSSTQRVDRLEEQLASLVDLALPAAGKGKKAAAAGDGDEDYDDWDMYSDDEPEASTSAKRNHIVFTDNIDAGAYRVASLRVGT